MDEKDFKQIKEPIKSTPIVVQNNDYQWGVISPAGEIIVPFGKYRWIDGFQKGLAKVIGYGDTTRRRFAVMVLGDDEEKEEVERQGLIDEKGEEVVPLEYTIWKFYGKDFPTIRASKRGREYEIRYGRPCPIPFRSRSVRYEEDAYDYSEDSWDAMTDGQYGDMPDGFDGDYSFLGY